MKRKNRVITGALFALALAATAGWVAMSHAGSDAGCSAKVAKVSGASGSGCPSAKAGACATAKAGACASAKATGCPSSATSATGACGAKAACGGKCAHAGGAGCGGAMGGGMGDLGLPEDTKMTRMDVENGVDLIFTGRDLAAIRTRLDGRVAACNGTKERACAGQTCTLASTDNSVVLSIRGPNAGSCCAMMTTATGEASTSEPAKPAKKKAWWRLI
jgi:hypothetical protein